MLSTILSSIGGAFFDRLFGVAKDIFHDYTQGKISEVEAKSRLLTAALDAAKSVEVSHSETLAKTFDSFQITLRGSALLQAAWVALFVSQMLTLVWHQLGIPALCYVVGNPKCYPSSGGTVEWAYLLLAFMLGAGPIVLRAGPGVGDIASRLKGLIGR